MKLKRLFIVARVIPKLGVLNFLYMIYYTFSLKFGLRKKRFIYEEYFDTEIFMFPLRNAAFQVKNSISGFQHKQIVEKADEILKNKFIYYNNQWFELEGTSFWFYDPYSQKELNIPLKHWCDINEFDLSTGDIKNLWELSRFDWVITLTKAYSLTGDEQYLIKLNSFLKDWCISNPFNQGINWKCGQEASIRVMKLYCASLVLNNLYEVSDSLFDFIFKHLERINGNIRYAVAQSNNHGTSEAAALYIGSLWLLNQKNSTLLGNDVQAKLIKYKKKGRRILENRIQKLVLTDGTFSQKSVNYHRVVIDTMSLVMGGMKEFKEEGFPVTILTKLDNLGSWLLDLISNEKGEVPNLGSNDGAMFEQFHELDYRDFRPSIQLFFGLLRNQMIWNSEEVLAPLVWRNIDVAKLEKRNVLSQKSVVKDKEFVLLQFDEIRALIIAKQDNFRPANDVLHLDVFYKGINVLIDTGSYSYNSQETNLFKSIKAHNTIQFGAGEPMPKISRFLNGEWIKVISDDIVENEEFLSWEGFYKDYKNNQHKRKVYLDKKNLEIVVVDSFKSFVQNQEVHLNFHLINDFHNYLDITCKDQYGNEIEMLQSKGEHSLYYMSKSDHILGAFVSTEAEGAFVTTLKFK